MITTPHAWSVLDTSNTHTQCAGVVFLWDISVCVSTVITFWVKLPKCYKRLRQKRINREAVGVRHSSTLRGGGWGVGGGGIWGWDSCSCIFHNLFCSHLLPDTLRCTHEYKATQPSLPSRNVPQINRHHSRLPAVSKPRRWWDHRDIAKPTHTNSHSQDLSSFHLS